MSTCGIGIDTMSIDIDTMLIGIDTMSIGIDTMSTCDIGIDAKCMCVAGLRAPSAEWGRGDGEHALPGGNLYPGPYNT